MDAWDAVRWLHLLAMALFVGGQLMLAAVVAPVMRGDVRMRAIARGFGLATAAAIAVAVASGAALAWHLERWGQPALHAKLGLLVLVGGLIAAHVRRPGSRALDLGLLASSLAVVAFAVALAH